MPKFIKIFAPLAIIVLIVLIFSQQKRIYDNTSTKNPADNFIVSTTDGLIKQEISRRSSLIGIECQNFNSRPYAIFLENDPVARPLSGISYADLVIEMPVYAGITRLLAFFQCDKPPEVGSIRSARYDFITLAKNFDAILVHFGGEKSALELLDKSVIDHIDALDYDGVYFYRKQKLKPPHNAFTDFSLLDKVRDKLGYRDTTDIKWSGNEPAGEENAGKDISSQDKSSKPQEIRIKYGDGYDVVWVYDQETQNYLRLRDSVPEIDNINKDKVSARNVVILEVKSKLLNDQYNSVSVIGEGKLWYFAQGSKTEGTWYKKDFNSRLEFFDKDGNKLELKPGKTWLEYVDQNSPFSYD